MFSVIIPLYNKELSIENTISSVLNQTYQDFEIIVINDGSSDNSLKIVEGIDDKRIKIIDKCNEGVSITRNRGIEEASYSWIAFLDGDDIWENNHLEIVSDMINYFPNEKLFATSFKYSDNRSVNRIIRNNVQVINNYFRESMKEHLIWTSVFVAHKSCFAKNKFNIRLTLGEDLELFARLVKVNSLVKSPKITATYRIDAENRSSEYKKYPMKKSFLSILSFNTMNSIDEKKYFKSLIIVKLKHFIVNKDVSNTLFLLHKYNINLL